VTNGSSAAATTFDIEEIERALIVTGRNNRTVFKPGSIQALADDIREHGLIQPPTVRPRNGSYQLVAGERRLRALDLLGWALIPCVVRPLSDAQAYAITLSENNHREEVDPIDQAHGFKRGMDEFGWDEATVAANATVDVRMVYKRLALLKLHPDIQDQIRSGNLDLSLAELMCDLDLNHQFQAVRVLLGAGRKPTIAEFRRITGDLLASQQQNRMFDESFWLSSLQEAAANGKRARKKRLPVHPGMPTPNVRNRKQWLANQAVDWARELERTGYQEGAAAILTFIEACIEANRLEADENQF
jgi:ParB/RepB/Spo0J family partition protein